MAVFTDSQSISAALLEKSTGLDALRFKFKGLRKHITIQCQWIPGHSDILGNELADSVAKQACSENAQLPIVTYTSICAEIRQVVKDPPIQHKKTVEVYSPHSSHRECRIVSRKDQTLLAKLRTGKYKELRAYKSLLGVLHVPSVIRNGNTSTLVA